MGCWLVGRNTITVLVSTAISNPGGILFALAIAIYIPTGNVVSTSLISCESICVLLAHRRPCTLIICISVTPYVCYAVRYGYTEDFAMLVTSVHNTWLKPTRLDSAVTAKDRMYFFKAGDKLNAVNVGKLIEGHYLLTLDHMLEGYTEWWVYCQHVSIDGLDSAAAVDLIIPFHPQYDNKYEPYTSCFATSVSMAMAYYGVQPSTSLTLEDELYLYLTDNGLDRFSWQDISYLLGKYGCCGESNTGGTFADIKHALDLDCPVIFGTYFTHAGHIVLIKGYEPDGLICHDPWGAALGNSEYDFTRSGADVHYSWDFISQNASDVRGTNPTDLWIMPVRRSK